MGGGSTGRRSDDAGVACQWQSKRLRAGSGGRTLCSLTTCSRSLRLLENGQAVGDLSAILGDASRDI